ncbi:MAG: type 1 glutamine amidotransferase [Actinomycetota bacterium]|nr:type 1 glutamine amidotransferase [Actinomycetota bacterium]
MTGHVHRTVAVVHGPRDPRGTLGSLIGAFDGRTELQFVVAGRDPFPDPSTVDLGIVMGSGASAYDDTVPWLADELQWLSRMADESSVLGVCFGAQALARALGGSVGRATEAELGWVTVETDDPALVGPGPWFEFHFDRFTTPPAANELARNRVGAQAFRYGRSLAVQFHPEISPRALDAWRAAGGADTDPAIVAAFDRLEAGIAEREDAARSRAAGLVEAFWSEVAGFGAY